MDDTSVFVQPSANTTHRAGERKMTKHEFFNQIRAQIASCETWQLLRASENALQTELKVLIMSKDYRIFKIEVSEVEPDK